MKALLYICRAIIVVGFVNLTGFILIALFLGGDAVSGGTSDGHYYLSSHGHRTEVTRMVWVYSRIHFYSAMVSAPAAIAAGIAAGFIKKKYPNLIPAMRSIPCLADSSTLSAKATQNQPAPPNGGIASQSTTGNHRSSVGDS